MDIRVIVWPPYSLDLNLIKNLWALVKAEIYRLYPELETAPDIEATLDLLVQAAQEAWHAINIGILYRLAMTM
jgi:transposase